MAFFCVMQCRQDPASANLGESPEHIVQDTINLIKAEMSHKAAPIISRFQETELFVPIDGFSRHQWTDKLLPQLGVLPKLLPPTFMQNEAGQQAQLGLASLMHFHCLSCQTAALPVLTKATLATTTSSHSDVTDWQLTLEDQTQDCDTILQTKVGLMECLACGSRCLLDLVSYQQLLWMRDAKEHLELSAGDWCKWASCIHDMWFRWHGALWDSMQTVLPSSVLTGELSQEADSQGLLAGPARLYMVCFLIWVPCLSGFISFL